ncbi:hypothetical protein [Serratia sp. DD3]|uniref:phage tail fiber protein n=1 Tax=Serratia sp. DD3 TaxID=1410619 RepID=UPI0003C4EBF8|nr:hypothetical protein [Serratia sp. DD3]KEY56928.1 hypothetical protein SRDD_41770 [Serratia sp. DD3]
MSSNGLPASNIVGVKDELQPRDTQAAANAASSSQAADSAAASADRAWMFSNDASASAASAKASENSAVAAMADALSKTTNTNQTVAGPVEFKSNLIFNGDHQIVATPLTPNVLIRFRDVNAVEKSAVFADTSTGTLSMRWNGTTYSIQGRADGLVSVPKGLISTTNMTAADIGTLSTTLGNYPIFFKGNDTASFTDTNNTNIGTWNGFAIVPTVGVGLSPGVSQGKPVFYVNARTGITYALNGLFVGNKPVVAGVDVQIAPPLIPSASSGERYCKIAQQSITAGSSRGMLFMITQGRQYGEIGMDIAYIYFSARGATTTILASNGLQMMRHGMTSSNPLNNINCGAIYNTTTGMWELWISGNGYNSPRVALIGNVETGTLNGVTPIDGLVWTATKPSGYTPISEKRTWTDFNTTVDANGFIKAASPIVKLYGDGSSELNDESQGVTTERIDTGIYRVSGVLGFNGDGAWGGAGNGIEIPVDDNKRPVIWIESRILPDGDIEIRTYHRTYDTGPYSARNIETMDSGEVYNNIPIYVPMPDGTPFDIPSGRWIDLRVEMPASDEPDPIFDQDE